MGYATYLFDMDGTLLDTLADLTAAVNHTLEQYGYPRRTIEQVRKGLGNGAAKLVAAMLPQGEKTPGFADIMRDYRAWYQAHACVETCPYPGVPTFGERPETPRKPAPDMVFHALAALGAGKENAVYVGDSEVDVQTARNAGLPVIGVAWGFRGREALAAAGAETIVDTAAELL